MEVDKKAIKIAPSEEEIDWDVIERKHQSRGNTYGNYLIRTFREWDPKKKIYRNSCIIITKRFNKNRKRFANVFIKKLKAKEMYVGIRFVDSKLGNAYSISTGTKRHDAVRIKDLNMIENITLTESDIQLDVKNNIYFFKAKYADPKVKINLQELKNERN